MAARACFAASTPLAILAITLTFVGCDGNIIHLLMWKLNQGVDQAKAA
jgi:hypothetical protein